MFDMKRPCQECPFLKVGGVRLTARRIEEIAGGILGMVVADGAIYLTRRSGTTTVMLSMPVKVLE